MATPAQQAQKYADMPESFKDLRACLICKLMKNKKQFEEKGCENCNWLLLPGEDPDHYTSLNHSGLIGLVIPREIWDEKHQRLVTTMPGVYACSVRGRVAAHIQRRMKKIEASKS